MSGVTVGSHAIAFVAGALLSSTLFSPGASSCLACSVPCGSLSCPAVTCSTANIEIGPLAGLILLIALRGLYVGCFGRRRSEQGTLDLSSGNAPLVDGQRSALGSSISWKPEQRCFLSWFSIRCLRTRGTLDFCWLQSLSRSW